MSANKTINVAVIGLGYWGPNLIRNLLKIPLVSAVYGCDLLEKNIQSIKRDFPNVILTKNYAEILRNKEIDAIVIATPIPTHFKLAKEALAAGKSVLVEKPMTTTSADARELIKVAKRMNKVLMAGHTFVYAETIREIKSLIEKGQLGKTYYYDSTRINLGLIQKDSDVIWDLAPHDLSIINYLFSEKVISVQAFGSKFVGNNSEIAHIFLNLENNISVHINISWLSPVKMRSIIIGGSKKMIVYNDIEPSEKIKIYDKGVIPESITPFIPAYRSGDVVIPNIEQKEALLTELLHFVDCIINRKEPLTSGENGLKIVSYLEAVEKALKTRKEVFL